MLDTVANLSACRPIISSCAMRPSGAPHLIARHVGAGDYVINAGDGRHSTRRKACSTCSRSGTTKRISRSSTVAIVGDVCCIRASLARRSTPLTTLGCAEIRIIGPKTLLPNNVESSALRVYHDMTRGLKDVDVVMMLRLQNERMQGALLPSAQDFYKYYGLTKTRLALAKPDAIVLHPGPMNRGVEIDSSVADGAQSVILPQVTSHRGAYGGDEHSGRQLMRAAQARMSTYAPKVRRDEDSHPQRPPGRSAQRRGP